MADPNTTSAAHFEGGFLVRVSRQVLQVPAVNVFLYNSVDDRTSKLSVWPENAKRVWIAAASATSRQVATSGASTLADGSQHYFLNIKDSRGNELTIHTEPYLAAQVCQASDGTIWTLGAETLTQEKPRSRRTYDTLRQYSPSGKLLKTALPRSNFNVGFSRAWRFVDPVYLRVAGGPVVVFDEHEKKLKEYVSSTGTMIDLVVEADSGPSMRTTGFALLADGTIYASRIGSGPPAFSTRGLYELVVRPSGTSSRWVPVQGAQVAGLSEDTNRFTKSIGRFLYIIGSDNQDLVYRTQSDSPGIFRLAWSHN